MDKEEMNKFVRENDLLYKYSFNIKTPLEVVDGTLAYLMGNIKHYLSGYGVVVTLDKSIVEDDRKFGDVPDGCKGCKWLKNKECWHEDEYYEQDWSDPVDCFERKGI